MRRAALVSMFLLAALLASCGGKDKKHRSSAEVSAPPPPALPNGCERVHKPGPKPERPEQAPQRGLNPSRSYVVTLRTSCGDLSIELDVKASPRTTASFVSLVKGGFYDDTVFHRIVPGFVVQGGDPTGTGNGGPGYSTRDVPPPNTRYTRGVVAMARTADEPSGTAGSQFYIVTGRDAGLPPEYALLGRVSGGLRTASLIDRLGDPATGETGTPTAPVVLQGATVRVR